MSLPYRRKDSPYLWIAPTIDGVRTPQSTGTADYQEALNLVRRIEGKIAEGLLTVTSQRITIAELCDLHLRDMRENNRRSIPDEERRIRKHIRPAVGHLKAAAWNGDLRSKYIAKRQGEGASNASINRELAAVKRAYNVGYENNLVAVVPKIKMLAENNVRKGFFREDHFRSVLHYSSPLLHDILIVAFYTGWRIKSILNLKWEFVDSSAARSEQTKNEMATVFPLEPFPELRAVFERRRQASKGLITPWVFHRNGTHVKSIKKAWQIARRKANVPGRIIHDFRRTAVRNLKSGGWADTEIMQMVGLKTLSMLIRYGITEEADIMRRAKTIAAAQRSKT